MKRVKLVNFYTGKISEAESIVSFCRKCGYKNNERFHLTPLIYGNKIQYDGWVLPGTYKEINEKFKIKDIYGNIYNVSVKEMITKFNIKSTLPKLLRFKNGKEKTIKGLYLYKTPINNFISKDFKIDEYVFKHGIRKYSGKTIKEISEKHNISSHSLFDMLSGKINSVKGVKFCNVKTHPKKILSA